VLAVLDGSDVDSGTAAEVGFAAALALPVVGLRTDVRVAGDNEATTVNLQIERFIRASGGEIALSLKQAIDALVEILARDA
jgi:nucleoside 2-deoxyribosyltransferase